MSVKILLCSSHPKPSPGAAWTRLGFFSKDWSKKGHQVSMLGSFTPQSFRLRGHKKIQQVDIFNLIPAIAIANPIFFYINLLFTLLVTTIFLYARKPDIVIVSVPGGDIGLGVLLASRITGSKCVVDYRDEWEDYNQKLSQSAFNELFYGFIKSLATKLYQNCDYLVATTSRSLLRLQDRGVIRCKLVSNGVDTKTFKPKKGFETSIVRFVYVGIIGNYYTLDLVVKALSNIISKGISNVRLVLAGPGDVSKVLKLVKANNLENFVEYRGVLSQRSEIADMICRSDVGIIPYDNNPLWRNTLPTKLFEYCACGIPVIVSALNDSLIAELVHDNQMGVITEPMNLESFASALIEFIENPDSRIAAGQQAYRFSQDYDRNHISAQFLNDLIQLVQTIHH